MCWLHMALAATMGPPDRPHILFLLQDDLGHYNVAFNSDRSDKPSADVASVSPQLTGLAKQGIILDRHYTHWHCSPSGDRCSRAGSPSIMARS